MGKYKNTEGKYHQVYHQAIELLNSAPKVSYSTKWLYSHLCLLEHRFTGKKEDFFFRSIKDLQEDMNMGRRQIIDGIKKLESLELIQTWQMHWIDKKTNKKSIKHITAFRILEP